jgi:diacylglycerol kinase (ATP)
VEDDYRWIFVVLNPAAGRVNTDALRKSLIQRLESAGIGYRIYSLSGGDNLKTVVQEAVEKGASLVVAAGGDGTVSGVADGLANSSVPLAVVPTGTGNVVAREFGIPLKQDQALQVIISSKKVRPIDLMQVGERYYLLNIGIGISSLTMRSTRREFKRRFGVLAYLWVGLKQLLGFQPTRFRIKIDGHSLSVRASEIMITNLSLFGMEPFHWDTDIEPDDGKLDLCIVRARNLIDYIRVGWGMLPGQRDHRNHLNCLTIERSLSLQSNPNLPVQADGEIIGPTPLELKIKAQALRILVPETESGEDTA